MSPGKIVAGKFRLVRLLGKGGMGSVWAAEHLGLKTQVALKFIDSAATKNASALARFEQEAKAAATIKSPHVVRVLDFGKDEEGHPYLAMELLEGEDLDARLARDKTISLQDMQTIVVQVCNALQKAHAAGFVHRDLKPGNIFLCKEEEGFSVKILDFGLAKSEGGMGLTGMNELLGTPDFMSPEQARGSKDIDFRTDFYSLGVVVYQCLTGRMPYDHAGSIPDLLLSITMREPVLASAVRSDLPAAVVSWLARAMQKDPKRRFDSAKEMASAFVDACTARRMVVKAPRISVAGEGAAGGEDITIRAQPDSAPIRGDEPTLRGKDTAGDWSSRMLDSPPSKRDPSPRPPADFKVDKTMPLGADASAFAPARASSDSPPRSLSAPDADRSPVVAPSGLPPFWVFVIAIVAITAGIYALLQWRAHHG